MPLTRAAQGVNRCPPNGDRAPQPAETQPENRRPGPVKPRFMQCRGSSREYRPGVAALPLAASLPGSRLDAYNDPPAAGAG